MSDKFSEAIENSVREALEKEHKRFQAETEQLKSVIVEQCRDVLLKQLIPVAYENHYPDVAVPKSVILMLPALMKVSVSTISPDNSKVNHALIEEVGRWKHNYDTQTINYENAMSVITGEDILVHDDGTLENRKVERLKSILTELIQVTRDWDCETASVIIDAGIKANESLRGQIDAKGDK